MQTTSLPRYDYWVSSVAFERAQRLGTTYLDQLHNIETWSEANDLRKQKEAEERSLLASIFTHDQSPTKGI
ncbi:MAG: hypothetical protein IPM83_15485 [Ignavibacteria bacterium]|nr:hypothetical protein [Ignavibacteria bacterium]